jgi:hypothetical protein
MMFLLSFCTSSACTQTAAKLLNIARSGWVANMLALCSRGHGFQSHLENQLSWLRFLSVFFSFSWKMLR